MVKVRHKFYVSGKDENNIPNIWTCIVCGLVKCEELDEQLSPLVEYSDHEGAIVAKGRMNKTPIPSCQLSRYP